MPGTLPFSKKSLHLNTSEGEQSPPGHSTTTSASAHEFSVFANVNIQGSSASLLSQSQVNLSAISTCVTDFSDTISLSSAMVAPELPKRSNSITSLANNINEMKPVLSPRSSDSSVTTTSSRHQPVVSPKCLESLREERIAAAASTASNDTDQFNVPPTISPRTDKYNLNHHHQNTTEPQIGATPSYAERSPFQNASQHHRIGGGTGGIPVAPNIRNCSTYSLSSINNSSNQHIDHYHHTTGDNSSSSSSSITDHSIGPIPISPHVNVPNTHSFNHVIPPPLPPRRREKKEFNAVFMAQIRQAPDAPQV